MGLGPFRQLVKDFWRPFASDGPEGEPAASEQQQSGQMKHGEKSGRQGLTWVGVLGGCLGRGIYSAELEHIGSRKVQRA